MKSLAIRDLFISYWVANYQLGDAHYLYQLTISLALQVIDYFYLTFAISKFLFRSLYSAY